MSQPDLFLATQLKEAGQARVLTHSSDWHLDTLNALQTFISDYTLPSGLMQFTMEDFRYWCEQMDRPAPPHRNAWGALTGSAAKRGVIRWTGKVLPGRRPENHGALLKVWEAA